MLLIGRRRLAASDTFSNYFLVEIGERVRHIGEHPLAAKRAAPGRRSEIGQRQIVIGLQHFRCIISVASELIAKSRPGQAAIVQVAG